MSRTRKGGGASSPRVARNEAEPPPPRSRSRAGIRRAHHGAFELGRVGGVAERGRRGDADPIDVQRSGSPDVAGEHHERAPEGLGRDPARLVDTLTQPGDHHVAREILEPTRPVRLGNQQAGRVRPWSTDPLGPGARRGSARPSPRPTPDHVIAAGDVGRSARGGTSGPCWSHPPRRAARRADRPVRSRAYSRGRGRSRRRSAAASSRSFSLEIQPSSRRETARTASGHEAERRWEGIAPFVHRRVPDDQG